MKNRKFEELVSKAIDLIPAETLRKIGNVAFVVGSRPGKVMRKSLKLKSNGYLLGLYQGVPITVYGRENVLKLPDKITIFQKEIEDYVSISGKEIKDVVNNTVWHEVAHCVGLDHDAIYALEAAKGIKDKKSA